MSLNKMMLLTLFSLLFFFWGGGGAWEGAKPCYVFLAGVFKI